MAAATATGTDLAKGSAQRTRSLQTAEQQCIRRGEGGEEKARKLHSGEALRARLRDGEARGGAERRARAVLEAAEDDDGRKVLGHAVAAVALHPPLAQQHALRAQAQAELALCVHVLHRQDHLLRDAARGGLGVGEEVPGALAGDLRARLWRGYGLHGTPEVAVRRELGHDAHAAHGAVHEGEGLHEAQHVAVLQLAARPRGFLKMGKHIDLVNGPAHALAARAVLSTARPGGGGAGRGGAVCGRRGGGGRSPVEGDGERVDLEAVLQHLGRADVAPGLAVILRRELVFHDLDAAGGAQAEVGNLHARGRAVSQSGCTKATWVQSWRTAVAAAVARPFERDGKGAAQGVPRAAPCQRTHASAAVCRVCGCWWAARRPAWGAGGGRFRRSRSVLGRGCRNPRNTQPRATQHHRKFAARHTASGTAGPRSFQAADSCGTVRLPHTTAHCILRSATRPAHCDYRRYCVPRRDLRACSRTLRCSARHHTDRHRHSQHTASLESTAQKTRNPFH